MKKSQILNKLLAHKQSLAQRFGLTGLALFGSYARDQAADGSDVDMLVSFDGPATSETHFGVQFFIGNLLSLPPAIDTRTHLAAC